MNPLFKLLAIMASVFLLGFFLEETLDTSGLNNAQSVEETFEILSELFSIFVALSIFAMTWYAYNKSKDNHSLFLGTSFLITGFLILYHLLSYPFMPDFITPNSSHKSAFFFLESRIILAYLLFASVYVNKNSLPILINKYAMFLLTIAILSVSLVFVFFHNDFPFGEFDLNSYSLPTVYLLLAISFIIFVTGHLYTEMAKETGQNNLNYLAEGSWIVLFSNLVYFSFEFSGHFLIITGFFYFYLGLYKSSVELPYEKLAVVEEKIRKGVENKYSTLFDNANDAIITTDLEYLVTSWNRSAEKLFGWEAQEVMGKKLSSLIVPLNLQTHGEGIIRDTLDGKSAFGLETEKIRKDGSKIFVSLTTSQLLDSNHNLAGLSFIIRDITERKGIEEQIRASLKEKEMLLKEIHHRVKNNLQIVSSLLDHQTQFIKDKNVIEIFTESQNRIASMALVHEKLYQSKDLARIDLSDYLSDLVANLFQSYVKNSGKIKLNMNIENIQLDIDLAIPCGLIINELVTNSLKYAFPAGRVGEITIQFRKTTENTHEFVIRDNGIGISPDLDFRKTGSLGLHLVTILAENQLHGEINLNRNEGTEFTIKFKGVK
ncbi:MAG: histidine kinase dimerization/phosphoacceptor domain -containing protein [Candidatus Methanoperedens sp.]